MDAGAVLDSNADERELEQLRRRAYGPAADIAQDPDALRRLEALEDVARTRAADASAAPPAAQPERAPRALPADAPVPSARPSESATPTSARARRAPVAWWRRRAVWIAAAAGAVVGAAAVWGGTAVLRPQPTDTLQVIASTPEERQAAFDDGYARSFAIDEGDAQRFEAYRGVTVWIVPTRTGGSCIVLTTEAVGTYGGSCVPRGMDPMFDLVVYQGMVPEVIEGLPVGSVARFTYRDGTVTVDEAIGTQFS